jgi:PmbA protein
MSARRGEEGSEDLLQIAESIVAKKQSGEQLEAYVARGSETEIRAYRGEVESLTAASSAGVGIRVLLESANGEGSKVGFAWAGSLDEELIRATLQDARQNAQFATPDPHVGFARPDGVLPVNGISLFDQGVEELAVSEKVRLAIELEQRVRKGDPRIRQVDSADYGDVAVEAALCSSEGILATSRRTSCSLSVSAIAGEGDDAQTGSGFSVGRGPSELDLEVAAADAITRAVRMLGAKKGASHKSVVVFDARVVSTILSVISAALSGEAVVKGRSFFATRIGETVARKGLSLIDDPTNPQAFTASIFDGEGLACRRNVLIENGVLKGFLFDTVSAHRAGVTSTGSAVRGGFAGTPGAGSRALVLSSTNPPAKALADEEANYGLDEILAEVDEGIFVQSVTGIHSGVNPISGDFSVGAEGLMIKDGSFADPVREITIASTLQRMLLTIVAVGNDLQWLPGIAAGQTVAIGEMQMSGN